MTNNNAEKSVSLPKTHSGFCDYLYITSFFNICVPFPIMKSELRVEFGSGAKKGPHRAAFLCFRFCLWKTFS